VFAAWTQHEPPLADAESRMAEFTELVATAIANAESRAELGMRVDEQAALRRVATLVVRGVPAEEIFSAVAAEVRGLFHADIATVARLELDGSAGIVGVAQEAGEPPIPTRWKLDGPLATADVVRTGHPARVDAEDIMDMSGENAESLRRLGVRSTVSSPILVDGRLWGVVTVSTKTEPLPQDTEDRMAHFSDLVATAIANAQSRAELEASRMRVVAASAEERRRIVRDLHDGAQQRLVHAVVMMKLALQEFATGDRHAEEYVSEALDNAEQANSELRELVHGILPRVLSRGGLRAGVEDLVSRASLPVTADVLEGRLPPAVEATAYFVVSEALTNAVKYSNADGVQVAARVDNGALRVNVRDDGVGGADPSRGSGLTGLRDRVEALGGTLEISSRAGAGTSLLVLIPIEGDRPASERP
jgi:signal transduction histidine kinase